MVHVSVKDDLTCRVMRGKVEHWRKLVIGKKRDRIVAVFGSKNNTRGNETNEKDLVSRRMLMSRVCVGSMSRVYSTVLP